MKCCCTIRRRSNASRFFTAGTTFHRSLQCCPARAAGEPSAVLDPAIGRGFKIEARHACSPPAKPSEYTAVKLPMAFTRSPRECSAFDQRDGRDAEQDLARCGPVP